MIDSPQDLSAALRKTTCQVRVSKSLYWHFMEVLPPVVFGTKYFVFQEGDGERLHFTQIGDFYYCHLMSDSLVSVDWMVHVNISRHGLGEPFIVKDVHVNDDTALLDRLKTYVGQKFFTVALLEQAIGVSFR